MRLGTIVLSFFVLFMTFEASLTLLNGTKSQYFFNQRSCESNKVGVADAKGFVEWIE